MSFLMMRNMRLQRLVMRNSNLLLERFEKLCVPQTLYLVLWYQLVEFYLYTEIVQYSLGLLILVDAQFFRITRKQSQDLHFLLRTHAPRLCVANFLDNKELMDILTVGRIHKFDYFQHVLDAYSMWRTVMALTKRQHSTGVNQFFSENQHFAQLKSFKLRDSIIRNIRTYVY